MSSVTQNMSQNHLPPTMGIGLKPQHYLAVLARGDAVLPNTIPPDWVEIHPQNYFFDGGPPHRWLSAIAEEKPLSFHSTGLSLGSASGLDVEELDRLAKLVSCYNPASVSDHLSWSNTPNDHMPDLFPIPYTKDALLHFADQVGYVQDRLARRILIENPSRMFAFAADEMDEVTFLNALCAKSGCGILLDLNNVEVSATNIGFDAEAYVDAVDLDHVGEVHLAGHAVEQHESGPLLIDDHGSPMSAFTLALYDRLCRRAGPLPTLIEWDTNVPDYAVLLDEMNRARSVQQRGQHAHAA
jgi:uncharacterized protein